MQWVLKHGGLVAYELEVSESTREQALEAALKRLGFELSVSLAPYGARDRYEPWQCDDGTYDFVDHTGEVCFTNLGKPNDLESAWVELDKRLKAKE